MLSPLDFVFWGLEIAEPHSLDLALCFDDAALLRAAPVVLVQAELEVGEIVVQEFAEQVRPKSGGSLAVAAAHEPAAERLFLDEIVVEARVDF